MKEFERQYTEQNDKYKAYNDSTSILSPDNQLEKVKNALKGDDNWAGRERKIQVGQKSNSPVTDAVVAEIVRTAPVRVHLHILFCHFVCSHYPTIL